MQDSCILKYIFDVTARSCEYFSFMNSDKSGFVVKTIFFIVSKKAPRVGKLLTLEKIVITYYLLDTILNGIYYLPTYKII